MTDHTITKHAYEHSPSFEQLYALLEVFPDAFFFKDGEGRWQIINEPAKRLFQLEGIPWKGKTDMELAELHPDFREIHEACIADDEKAWQAKQLIVVEEKMVREDGRQATYETRKLPLFKENGERAGIMIIGRDITAEKAAEERIKQMAFYDDLTALPNRRFLEIIMKQGMARAKRHDRLLAVCMMDLDGFKPVNDIYGHEAGDEVLVAMGKRLPEALRKSDFVARLGGDEFVLLVEDLEDLDDLANIMKKIESIISASIPLSHGESVQIGASMGVAIYPFGDTDTGDKLLRLADQAMYESKTNKADRERFWVLFGEEIHKSAPRTPAQHLLDSEALEVWYQPIMDSRTRKVVGVEALARLRDKDDTLWLPEKFLPQLQDEDLFDLSKKVLTQALADMPTLDAQGFRLWVSVNIDPVSVSEACISCLREMIAQGSVDPSRISLEILERSNFLEQQMALEHLLEMKALGVHLALDDIGSAYSSLLRLKDLPIDEIKLDHGFIRTLGDCPQDLHFVGAIQELAAGLGVDLVVEGVETEDILDAVTFMGAYLLQGYAIAKPMPLTELRTFLGRTLPHQQHPNSLLGLYAKQLVHHNALKKAICHDPKLVDYMTLVDATSCPVYADIQRLVADGDGLLDKLHQEYHRAIANMDTLLIASPATNDWTDVERAQDTLEQAIIGIYCKRKTEHGHSAREIENPTDSIATDHF